LIRTNTVVVTWHMHHSTTAGLELAYMYTQNNRLKSWWRWRCYRNVSERIYSRMPEKI